MLNKESLINNIEEIKISHNDFENNIVFSADLKYSKYIGVVIASILENNSENYNFHIFVNEINNKDKARLNSLNYFNANIFLYIINDDTVKELQVTQHFSTGMYYRLLVPHILYGKVDQFLYLDVDVICNGSLIKLFSTDLSDKVAAVVPDTIEQDHIEKLYQLGFPKNGTYFNSGVLFVNTKKWVDDKVTEDFLTLINNGNNVYPDQDVLNILVHNKVIFLNEEYNYQKWLKLPRKEFYEQCKYAKIIHFIGPFKPWQLSGYNKIYNFYYNLSPWRTDPLEYSTSTKGLKKASKYLWQDGDKLRSIIIHIKYLTRKLFNII